ncbi:MAG: hypothetical protein QM765_43580 [Myxococcales bacterium]
MANNSGDSLEVFQPARAVGQGAAAGTPRPKWWRRLKAGSRLHSFSGSFDRSRGGVEGGMGKVLLWLTMVLLAVGVLARWQSARQVERASELVDRSRDASHAFAASLDGHHSQAEVLLLDARRVELLGAARWRAAGWLSWAVALAALLGAWVGQSFVARGRQPVGA